VCERVCVCVRERDRERDLQDSRDGVEDKEVEGAATFGSLAH